MVKIHIWHDSNGQIIAVGRSSAHAKSKALPIAGHRQGVLETLIEENAIRTLHQTHKVDARSNTLVKVVHAKTISR